MKRRKIRTPKDLMWTWNFKILTLTIKYKHVDSITTRCVNFHCSKEKSRSVS